MKSGGRILGIDTQNSRDTDSNSRIDQNELQFIDTATGNRVAPQAGDDIVFPDGRRYTWQQLQTQYQAITVSQGQNLASAAENREPLSPEARRNLLNQLEQQATVERNAQQQVVDARTALQNASGGGRTTAQQNLDSALQNLTQQQQILRQQLALARQRGISEGELRRYSQLPGESAGENGAGTGTGSFSASSRGMSIPGVPAGPAGPAGAAGAEGQGGPRGVGFPGGGGFSGSGDPLFTGFEPPTSAAYGAALYMDGMISDGLGQIGASRREGQKLMMLFFYFARMAESGDPFAMYNFIKFITYIISKDKARQNIHIGSKLIQLQDLSRKATETLMATPTDDPNKMHEFTKALHQAKSQESMIATAQKLLADTLQEFQGVSDGLISVTKNLQEFWFRASRTSVRQA